MKSASLSSHATCVPSRMLRTWSATAVLIPSLLSCALHAAEKPNIILLFADDISARELPIYGSNVWSPPEGGNTADPQYRAKTPVLDRLAEQGCLIENAWADVVCSPSRAMMMTGRYAHVHKWWENSDYGRTLDAKGKPRVWPLYASSPKLIGHIAQEGGYATYWAGKSQMKGSDLQQFGFDEGVFTPGEEMPDTNPNSDFQLIAEKSEAGGLINLDTGKPVTSYAQQGWYWKPNVTVMNQPGAASNMEWWPNSDASKEKFGLNTYGPDVELEFIFDFMERQKSAGKPFFIYHTSHLGHDGFDWLHPSSTSKWPGTPVIKWDGEKYTRTEPDVTGDNGDYDTHGTVTDPGIHHHINYLDYQVWLYQNKLRELGLDKNTIFIFCADNGTSGYGKNSSESQKGTHVPLIIHAPGMTKRGKQDVLVSMADMLPTLAEITGVKIPAEYEVNGESLVPFLFTDKPGHREWLYAYKGKQQLVRSKTLLKDGNNKWWNMESNPADLISFQQITDWKNATPAQLAERKKLEAAIVPFNTYETAHDAPGVKLPNIGPKNKAAKQAARKAAMQKERKHAKHKPKAQAK